MVSTWQELCADKKQRQHDAIPKEWLITIPNDETFDVTSIPEQCGLLTSRELEITSLTDVDKLLRKLAVGEWSSVEVTTAFYKRAVIAHQLTNCLTEIFVEKALARAAEMDARLKATGKVVGPLHGLPVSLKDQLAIKGIELTMGYASWVGRYSEKDAVLIELLYECGAVPFVRTNVPQTLMWGETYNHVFGRTTNPHNRALTSGGSSGGEGALIALKGSPLGVGSDIGGSIRIPSAFCGVYGLRPSSNRIPYEGAANSLEGQDSFPSVLGPLSNSLSGVRLFMKSILQAKPWLKDALVVRKQWDDDAYQLAEHGGGKELCFGIMWNDGHVVPHPPISRALETAKKALLAAGHKVIDWTPYNHPELVENARAIWSSGSSEDFQAIAAESGEPLITSMYPDNRATFRVLSNRSISAYELWQLHKRRRQLRQEYFNIWEATTQITGTGRPIDAIICPCAPYTAPPHGANRITNYTTVWNALDYPALVLPVSKFDASIDIKQPAHEFLSELDKSNYEFYDPAIFKNAPISLQLVGRTQEDEAVIGIGEIVAAALKH